MASTAADIIASAKAEAEAARQSAVANLSGLGTDITNAYNNQQAATNALYQNQLNQLQSAYDANAKQAYTNYMQDRQQVNNELTRLGLRNTGYGVSQELISRAAYGKNLAGLQSAYQTNVGNVGVAQQGALADLYNAYAKNKLGIDQYIYEAGRSAYDTAYKNSYQAQQDAISNALQQQYYNYLYSTRNSGGGSSGGSSGYSEPTLSDTSSSSGSSNKIVNVAKNSPMLSSRSANSWYDKNIDARYFNGGLTESELETILSEGLRNKSISQSDANKILNTFGL